jgi:hypothetical protein
MRWRKIARNPWSPFFAAPVLYPVFLLWVPDVVAAIFGAIVALVLVAVQRMFSDWRSRKRRRSHKADVIRRHYHNHF